MTKSADTGTGNKGGANLCSPLVESDEYWEENHECGFSLYIKKRESSVWWEQFRWSGGYSTIKNYNDDILGGFSIVGFLFVADHGDSWCIPNNNIIIIAASVTITEERTNSTIIHTTTAAAEFSYHFVVAAVAAFNYRSHTMETALVQ